MRELSGGQQSNNKQYVLTGENRPEKNVSSPDILFSHWLTVLEPESCPRKGLAANGATAGRCSLDADRAAPLPGPFVLCVDHQGAGQGGHMLLSSTGFRGSSSANHARWSFPFCRGSSFPRAFLGMRWQVSV